MHSPKTGVGIRSTTNLTKQRASLRLAQAIAESSFEINACRAYINSSSCSCDFESLLASYSAFLMPENVLSNTRTRDASSTWCFERSLAPQIFAPGICPIFKSNGIIPSIHRVNRLNTVLFFVLLPFSNVTSAP